MLKRLVRCILLCMVVVAGVAIWQYHDRTQVSDEVDEVMESLDMVLE